MSSLWMPCLVYHEKKSAGISYGSLDQFESDNVQSKVVSAVRIWCTYSVG